MKKRIYKGVMLLEVALCLLINVPLILGGLEFGWYLYVRSSLAGAAGQAVMYPLGNGPQQSAMNYLIGLDFSDNFINSITVDWNSQSIPGSGGKSIESVTVSLPLADALLFGGNPSKIILVATNPIIGETAYMRD